MKPTNIDFRVAEWWLHLSGAIICLIGSLITTLVFFQDIMDGAVWYAWFGTGLAFELALLALKFAKGGKWQVLINGFAHVFDAFLNASGIWAFARNFRSSGINKMIAEALNMDTTNSDINFSGLLFGVLFGLGLSYGFQFFLEQMNRVAQHVAQHDQPKEKNVAPRGRNAGGMMQRSAFDEEN